MRMISNVPSGSVIYGEGRIGTFPPQIPAWLGAPGSPLPILEAPGEEPLEAQKSGLSPKPSGHNPEPRYWGSEIVVIVEAARLQGPACFNLVTAPLAGVEDGRQQVPGSSWREKRLLADSHLVPTPALRWVL